MDLPIERREYVFSGRVQGVGFRATVRSLAKGHAVTGWIRNEADGSVRMQVQGERGEIEALVDRIRASFQGLLRGEHTTGMPVEPAESAFEIRR